MRMPSSDAPEQKGIMFVPIQNEVELNVGGYKASSDHIHLKPEHPRAIQRWPAKRIGRWTASAEFTSRPY
jgi:hypothetical protein